MVGWETRVLNRRELEGWDYRRWVIIGILCDMIFGLLFIVLEFC